MLLKCFIFCKEFNIKNTLYVAGKNFPLCSIKDKEYSPHMWG